MNDLFLLKCFLIGISAASALGPIFVLTFNNSALHGFFKGFFNALGAALGDGCLLFLGLIGVLSVLEESHKYQVGIDFAGGLLLLAFGLSMFFAKITVRPLFSADTAILSIGKTFLFTILNPLTLFFFMFISTQILEIGEELSISQILTGCWMTLLGSLTILSTVAFIGSTIGNAISQKNLRHIAHVTGTIILGIGAYFFFDAIRVLIRIYS